ncbi:hypothetical protein AKJ16_DCAP15632 [Drosera capensis]
MFLRFSTCQHEYKPCIMDWKNSSSSDTSDGALNVEGRGRSSKKDKNKGRDRSKSRVRVSQEVGLHVGTMKREVGYRIRECPTKMSDKKEDKACVRNYVQGNLGRVYLGDDKPCDILGNGDVHVQMENWRVLSLQDVRHVPKLIKNLISASYGEGSYDYRIWDHVGRKDDVDTRKSTIGYVFTLGGDAISYVSRLQKVTPLSTTEVEEGMHDHARYFSKFLEHGLDMTVHNEQELCIVASFSYRLLYRYFSEIIHLVRVTGPPFPFPFSGATQPSRSHSPIPPPPPDLRGKVSIERLVVRTMQCSVVLHVEILRFVRLTVYLLRYCSQGMSGGYECLGGDNYIYNCKCLALARHGFFVLNWNPYVSGTYKVFRDVEKLFVNDNDLEHNGHMKEMTLSAFCISITITACALTIDESPATLSADYTLWK